MYRFKALLLCLLLCVIGTAHGEGPSSDMTRNLILPDENSNVFSMAGNGDVLYILRSDGLFFYKLGEDAQVCITPEISPFLYGKKKMNALMSDGETLYGFDESSMTVTAIDVGSLPPNVEVVYSATRLLGNQLTGIAISGDVVAALSTGGPFAQGGEALHLFNMRSNGYQRVQVENAVAVCAYKEGQWLVLSWKREDLQTKARLVSIDFETGSQQPLHEWIVEDMPGEIAFDTRTGIVYVADRHAVYALTEDAKKDAMVERVASVLQDEPHDLVVLDGSIGAVASGGQAISIRPLDGSALFAQNTLIILDYYGKPADYASFLSGHNTGNLIFYQNDFETLEERFIQDMITRSSNIDVYVLCDTNTLAAIKDKGYAVNMAEQPLLKSLTNDMYPGFRDALVDESSYVYAFPKTAFVTMLTYDEKLFEEFGFAVPSTYGEYFDFCINWWENYAKDFPRYEVNPFINDMDIESLSIRYANEMSKNGKAIRFQDDVMKEILVKYHALMELLASEEPVYSNSFFNMSDIPYQKNGVYLPLVFDKENQYTFSPTLTDFSFYVINPYSENKELALELVASRFDDMEPYGKALLFSGCANPIPNDRLKEELDKYEGEIAALKELMEAAEPHEKRKLSDDLDMWEQILEIRKQDGEWIASPEDIVIYQSYVDSIYINPYNPVPILIDQYPELFHWDLEAKPFDVDAMTRAIDEKMIAMERERQ